MLTVKLLQIQEPPTYTDHLARPGSKGEVLDLGRSKRLITPGLRDYLHVRDGGCSYPGCTIPPAWCDGHHIIHWTRGGPTDRDHTALLCRHHHTVVHRHDHTATIDDDGVHWTRADGTPMGNTDETPGSSPPADHACPRHGMPWGSVAPTSTQPS